MLRQQASLGATMTVSLRAQHLPLQTPGIKAPVVSLSAAPSSVEYNGNSTLTWSSTNADTCTASGDWSGAKETSGTEAVGPLTADSTFTLSCSGAGGNISRSAAVNVASQSGSNWLSESFDGYAVGDDPINWFDTARDNSMSHDEAMFKVFDVEGQKVSGTAQTATTNIHSHYIGAGSESWTNYEYTGRMRISGVRDGIGVTFFSDYPNTDSYYRLRRQGSGAFHISPHGSGIGCSGTTDTGVVPAANAWYLFKIQVENTSSQTEVRARVWREGSSEPASWQASCSDTGTRRTSGTVGLWGVVSGQDSGTKHWDDLVTKSLTSPQGPTLTFTANPTSIDYNGSTTLTWSSTNADSCTATDDWSATKGTSGNETVGPLTAGSTFTLTCSGSGGEVIKSATVSVGAAPQSPTLTLTTNPTTVDYNGSTTLTWSSTNADGCTATGGWSGSKGTSGAESVGPLTADSTFTLTCSGSGGEVIKSATVTVGAAPQSPTLTLTTNPNTVDYNGSTTLTWSSTNADGCTATGGWSGSKGTSGAESVGPLTADSTFTLTCSGSGGEVIKLATVTVGAAPQSPTLTLTANPTTTEYNGSTTLSWSSTHADSCMASGDWSGSKGISGSETVGSLTVDSTFTLSCSGAGGNINRSAAVNVGSQPVSNWLSESFDGFAVGDDPINWFDTARDNSMSQDETMFKVFDVAGQKVFGTSQTATTNIHSHYIGAGSESWKNYEYTGRMRISGVRDEHWGDVLFGLSQYRQLLSSSQTRKRRPSTFLLMDPV